MHYFIEAQGANFTQRENALKSRILDVTKTKLSLPSNY